MAYLDHTAAYKDFRDRALEGIKKHFPIIGGTKRLELNSLEVKEGDLHADDIRAQHEARVQGKTWAAPVYGELSLKDGTTGKLLDKRKVRMAEIPRFTSRNSQIVDGNEYQMDNQWQLKPGVYSRRRVSGEIEANFNIDGSRSFDITFNPNNKKFLMSRGGSSAIHIYPILKTLGIDDDTLEKQWGKEILQANKAVRGNPIAQFYKTDNRVAPKEQQEAVDYLLKTFEKSKIRPEVTEITLGKKYDKLDGEVIAKATRKLLDIQGGASEDDRDSLIFKNLRSAGDYAYDKLVSRDVEKSIKDKIVRKMYKANDIRDVFRFDLFNIPIKSAFHENSAASTAKQINPVEMLASAQQTTIGGPGGIQSQHAIDNMVATKFVNPSHQGYLDPVRTPESSKSGVILRLPMGITKRGNDPVIALYNVKKNTTEYVDPTTYITSHVVLPDQINWKNGKPVARSNKVKASGIGNVPEEISIRNADYVMKHPSQLFSVTTNLIPFLGNNSGGRATYATHHIEQAISLKERDAPLVQSSTGSDVTGLRTFDEIVGRRASHVSPLDGKIEHIGKDSIEIRGSDGKIREVQLYNNFPLNDPKAMLHSTPTIKVGDKVTKGQSVADSNYTRNGVLALGVNLRAAYIPYKGYNFEDGVVISRSASDKLVSEHLHKPDLRVEKDTVTDPKKFIVQHPDAFGRDQYNKLDSDGVIRVGQKVKTGDPLAIAMRPFRLGDSMSLKHVARALSGRHTDSSLRWTSDHEGEVVGVHKGKGKVAVHVRTREPMQIGDKLAGRYGNKGIVTRVIDDNQMPHTKDGKHVDILLNPSGVPGRLNVGQVLETVAGKIAEKTGKTYVVDNFSGVNQLAALKKELKSHKLTDQEELIDPETGLSLGKALVGPQHILKLVQQINTESKSAVRSGMALPGGEEDPETYDINLMPSRGGSSGGQSIGSLDLYTLLSHGAKASIREIQTLKSEGPDPQEHPAKKWPSQHTEVWDAIQLGEPLPTPRSTFSFRKFTDFLRGTGVNVDKKGHNLHLLPLTDKQILKMSEGREVTKPGEVVYPSLDKFGEPKPKPGGIFDPKITGGHGGFKWSHIKLAEPLPNPVFEAAIQRITGLNEKEYLDVVQGKKALTSTGDIVALGTNKSISGGPAIASMLEKINVNKDLSEAEKELSQLTVPSGAAHGKTPVKIDKLVKKIKYLRALRDAGLQPKDAYVLNNLPVIPPVMRPPSTLESGSVKWGDLNELYADFGQINTAYKDYLQDPKMSRLIDDEDKQESRESLYDGMKALMGIGTPYSDQTHKGILHQISGESPKKGYFQNVLMKRRQDMSMRSTIVPEPALGLDEVGLPTSKALTLYKPFVVRKLVEMGAADNVMEARNMVVKKDPYVEKALSRVVEERPILLKRDPALHRHSIQGFKVKLVAGKAIQIHPLVTSGFNADFDGDQMSAYVPVHQAAVEEARKMMPSNNLFNEASGRVIYQPTLESALGLYKLSRVEDGNKKFNNAVDAVNAVNSGKMSVNELATIGGKRTTVGRLLIASALPTDMHNDVLTNHSSTIDKGGLNKLFTTIAEKHKAEYGDIANKLKDIGNGAAYGAIPIFHGMKGPGAIKLAENPKQMKYVSVPTHSLGLDDLEPDTVTRDKHLNSAQREVDKIKSMSISNSEKDRRTIDAWLSASKNMGNEHAKKIEKNPTNLSLMLKAGVKPSQDQYKQIALAPILMADAFGKPIPHPIKKSYSEGLDLSEYWTQMQGARRGTVMKVMEVQDPGTFTKRMVQTTMDMVVTEDDCGTNRGIAMNVGDKNIYDRRLATDFEAKGVRFSAGTILTPDVVTRIRTADPRKQVIIRSPLKCENAKGLCKKCAGLSANGTDYEIGTNVGILASQALGERSTQLTLKAFHKGGVVESTGGARAVNDFKRVEQLAKLPDNIPNSSILAMTSGKIDKIEQDPTGVKMWIGGKLHHVGKDVEGRPLHENLPFASKSTGYKPWKTPKVGEHITAGETLSDPNRTDINPRDLYKATNDMERVQNFLTDELSSIYGNDVRRQHVETVVKAMGNLTLVRDPGDAEYILKGEFQPASKVRAMNRELIKAGKKPIEHSPVLKGIENMPLSVQEDWMAKLQHTHLRDTLQEAAALGASSNIHGIHPVPGAAYGAEFGLTSTDSKKPGLGHLKNVPRYAY